MIKPTNKINVITLGCSKNIVDSEVLIKQLDAGNLIIEHDSETTDAQTVIINTCGFINDAKEESIETILRYARARKKGEIQNLYVIGCLSERYKEDLRNEIPEVDRFFGVNNLEQIVKSLGVEYRRELLGERNLVTPGHYAYLKIAEGCDRKCAFCAIPLIRGKHRSRTIESLVNEAVYLAGKGVKELILISQDLSYYGLDIYHKQRLKDLIDRLSEITGIEWIRLHYLFPANFPADILPAVQNKENICSYLDIPFQHIADPVLKAMRRGITGKETYKLINRIRKEVPGIALRTTLLTGYPGESKKDFAELKKFVSNVRFDRLGIFTYSHEEDTYSFNNYKDDIPKEVKMQRAEEIMTIQEGISNKLNKEKTGNEYKVIIDRQEGDYFVGRTEFDSPEVDQEVLIKPVKGLITGEFRNILITGYDNFDLYGRC
ncbi:MAG: 30S ribosomal protein S12 methylthiotransferase RimO [Bacteroidales bacterium]|nr:30S ribosomal protein S12 methylthiotransferase RimO [Bacteroidales bacterium]